MVFNAEEDVVDLNELTEAELEHIIANDESKADDARYVLGRHLYEGTSPTQTITMSVEKAMAHIDKAALNGHLPSIEYKFMTNSR